MKEGTQPGFSLAVNDNDIGINRGWIEFGIGINYTKNPDRYGDLFLVK